MGNVGSVCGKEKKNYAWVEFETDRKQATTKLIQLLQ